MKYKEKYIANALLLISKYIHDVSLPMYLKLYFSKNKKHGSKDRKILKGLVYGYYRLGKLNTTISPEDRMYIGSFLSSSVPIDFFKENELFFDKYTLPLSEKIKFIEDFHPLNWVFEEEFSEGVDTKSYLQSIFNPSYLHIRIRKKYTEVMHHLKQSNLNFTILSKDCISIEEHVDIKKILPWRYYTIQDYTSQQVSALLHTEAKGETWWDCCSGSGGKSLYLLDNDITPKILATDIRHSILKNYEQRLKSYGYNEFTTIPLDCTNTTEIEQKIKSSFNTIVCDVPCSGSGTWNRNPEHYFYYTTNNKNELQKKQIAIVNNVLTKLNKGGVLYYITCSVFKYENEDVITALINTHPNIEIAYQKIISGIDVFASSFFIAKITRLK